MATPRSVLYVRSAAGGRASVEAQERRLRCALERAGIEHENLHAYFDVNTPGTLVGAALCTLMSDASWGVVGTVYVQDVSRLGRLYDLLLRVLTSIEGSGAKVVTMEELELAPAMNRSRGRERRTAQGLITLGFGLSEGLGSL